MFRSATLKLTGWYLLILTLISLLFSVAIYQLSFQEVDKRLEQLQTRFESTETPPIIGAFDPSLTQHDPKYTKYRDVQLDKAKANLISSLFYINLTIVLAGGIASYLLARRTLQNIEELHEAQSRFTSDASHELRTPLAAMKSEIEVILRDPSVKKTDLRETLESNLEEVNNLTKLSQILLEIAKADNASIDLAPVNMGIVVETAVGRLRQPKRRLKLTVDNDLPLIEGNETGLEELSAILTENALKYSPEKSLVSVKVTRRGSKICLEVTNTGPGITPEALPHIFERFYRADTSRTGSGKSGYGLGLALAKKITDLHHGEISAVSQPDHATIFTVLLPIKR